MISILGKWNPEDRKAFRKGTPEFFLEDERKFEKWDDHRVQLLKHEFMRFKVLFPFFIFLVCVRGWLIQWSVEL